MTGTILIVDDERAQREIIQTILEGEGYRVAAAPGGARPWSSSKRASST